MKRGWFIVGTDTDVGKTQVAAGLLTGLAQRGSSVGMKPVASGCRRTVKGLRNADAEALLAAGNVDVDYALVNPYAFEPPVAPHLAARQAGITITPDIVCAAFKKLQNKADFVVVEGVGGWLVPLGADFTMADIAKTLGLPVILVVGMRLGCLNHALLTAAAIQSAGLAIAGWIANEIDSQFQMCDKNVVTLHYWLGAPLLGRIPYQKDKNELTKIVSEVFSFDQLLYAAKNPIKQIGT